MKYSFLIILFLISILYSQKSIKYGEYRYTSFLSPGPSWWLELKKDSTFRFKVYNDLDYWGPITDGKWTAQNDTLQINSFYKVIPKTFYLSNVIESRMDSNEFVNFEILDKNNEEIGAFYFSNSYINDQFTGAYMDFIDSIEYPIITTINKAPAQIDSVSFSLKHFTYKYYCKSKKMNHFRIKLAEDEIPNFLEQEVDLKFFILNDSLKYIHSSEEFPIVLKLLNK